MTVSEQQYLKKRHSEIKALGDKVISSDGSMVIEGFEGMYLLTKQFPWPTVTPVGEIEVPTIMGTSRWQSGQAKLNHQGAVTLQEVVAGSVDDMLLQLLQNGGTFDAKVYEGIPQAHLRYKPIYDCFFTMENPDRDFENRTQVLTFSGTLFFHYFGEVEQGNSDNYR
ncbi:hypothetical protein [Methylocucumis oryzae]|uniref:Uncharacterized protein n=1 Tax=Methylocucumis oryzae TaxID=1632867 RepID=A0A0F3IMW6_9GAMM|nr:hypothetical protein [Methylocucumis oryzae]KJV08065.1 hypothetical protein VZ94_00455 [Methylocucumis oryzae]